MTPEIQQPKRRNPPNPNPATQTFKPHIDLNPDTKNTGAQSRPNNEVELREATSIHKIGGDWRCGSEADGGVGLRRSALGRGLGRRQVEEGGERKKKWRRRRGVTGRNGEGGEKNK